MTTTRSTRHGRLCFALAAVSILGCASQNTVPAPNSGGMTPTPATFVAVPDPLLTDNPRYALISAPVPEVGRPFADASFGTTLTRVGQTEQLRHEYSRHDPFNLDGTLILLQYLPDGEWRVYRTAMIPYDGSGNLIRPLDLEEPRWDPSDPAVIWGFRGFQIIVEDVFTGQIGVIKDFAADPTIAPILAANPDLYRITMKDEGEPSSDMRFWALMLQGTQEDYRGRYLLVWDRREDQIIGLYPLPAAESLIDWVGMSTLGNWVLIGGDWNNGGKLAGLTMADRTLTTFQRLDYATGHADVGLDSEGREVIVMQSGQTDFIDMLPLDQTTKPILEAGGSYDGTGRIRLVRLSYDSESPFNLNSGVHISCNAPGYCVVSTYTEPDRPERNWLDRTITLIRLDRNRPRMIYLAKVHGTAAAYWEETHASISRDGTRVVWSTNWNRSVGQERVWLMELTIPTAWLTTLEE